MDKLTCLLTQFPLTALCTLMRAGKGLRVRWAWGTIQICKRICERNVRDGFGKDLRCSEAFLMAERSLKQARAVSTLEVGECSHTLTKNMRVIRRQGFAYRSDYTVLSQVKQACAAWSWVMVGGGGGGGRGAPSSSALQSPYLPFDSLQMFLLKQCLLLA